MDSITHSINVPNILNYIEEAPSSRQNIFDLSQVRFVKPCGLMALFIAARHLSQCSGQKVTLRNIDTKVLSYLERMDLFQWGSSYLTPDKTPEECWNRAPKTNKLLELTPIQSTEDVGKVVERAYDIFSRWLGPGPRDALCNVLSELCTNIYDHSGDRYGSVAIQCYQSQGQSIVCVAVGDLGRGIRGSLSARYGGCERKPLYFLNDAMSGKTSRLSGRGGMGLQQLQQIVEKYSGCLWLRSENSAILSRGPGKNQGFENLVDIPGTQASVELRSP
jgi:anti-anti-sigma regulatory factor